MSPYALPAELGNRLLKYLELRPYVEVHALIADLLALARAPAPAPESQTEEDTP